MSAMVKQSGPASQSSDAFASGRDRNRPLTRAIASLTLCLVAAHGAPTEAKRPVVQISEKQELRFGKFAVPTAGQRTVGTDGSVRDRGLLSVGPSDVGPATFVVSYDRGNQSKRQIAVELVLTIQSGSFSGNRLSANLKNFTSDIPGAATLQPGQPVSLKIPNCQSRICTASFRIGATMEVSNSSGGGEIAIPVYLDVLADEVT